MNKHFGRGVITFDLRLFLIEKIPSSSITLAKIIGGKTNSELSLVIEGEQRLKVEILEPILLEKRAISLTNGAVMLEMVERVL